MRSLGNGVSLVFSRGVRTRSKFKVEIKRAPENGNPDAEIDREVQKIEAKATDAGIGAQVSVRRSRFASGKNSASQLKSALGYKDPEEIKKELLERFKRDGVEPDPEFIDKMVDESHKEAEILQKYVENPKSMQEELTNDELEHFVDWLISDGQRRVLMDGASVREADRELNNLIKSNDQSPEALVKAFEMLGEVGQDGEDSLQQLPQFLYRMTRLRNSELAMKITVEKWIALYGVATAIKNDGVRNQCIYLCGRLLYSALKRDYGPKMRPDPINEKFYVEALVSYEEYAPALELYESRKEKDVKDERFWFELGTDIHLAKGDMDKAIEIIDYIKDRWGYVSSLVLVHGLKVSLTAQNIDDAMWFWEEIQMNMESVGLVAENYIPETQTMDESQVVFDYYNRIEPVSWGMLDEVVFAFVGNMRFNESFSVLGYADSADKGYISHFVETFEERFDSLGLQLFVNELRETQSQDIPEQTKLTILNGLGNAVKEHQSIDETLLLNNIHVYLNRLALTNKKDLATINDLREMVKKGAKLTTFDANSLLDVLLGSKSNVGLKLATEILNFANRNAVEETTSLLPKADAKLYNVFCNHLLSHDRPRLGGLEGVFRIMAQSGIPIDETLASNVISKLILNKQYGKAIAFIEQYVLTDDPISVHTITPGASCLWNTCLLAYYQLVFVGKSNIDERNKSLRLFVDKIVANRVQHEAVFKDTVGVLLAFNDIPTCIAFITWYASLFGEVLPTEIVLGIKGKLEERLVKLDDRLSDNQRVYVDQYKHKYGLAEAIGSRAKPQHAQSVLEALREYSKLFGYVPNSFKLALESSDDAAEQARVNFEQLVHKRCAHFQSYVAD